MSLETLLEAARYVELQEAQRMQETSVTCEDHLTPPPRSSPSQLACPTSNGSLALSEEPPKDFQKRAAGTREVHNKLEKNRRAHLKECFELLKKQLPSTQEEKKSSNLSILHSALRYIQVLKRKEREYEHEMERLAREKISAQQRLSNLKKELSAQWDHIDFNTLLPENQTLDDIPPRDEVSRTTSTASEREDAVSDPEEPLSKCGVMYSSTSSLSSAATSCSPSQPQPPPPPPAPSEEVTTLSQHHVQLPVSAHMVNTGAGLAATLVSPIQLLASSGLRVLPADTQPLALTVHHTSSPHIPVTNVTNQQRVREAHDVRTTTPISLSTLHLNNKMVAGGVTIAEAARLSGGAELNLLPANGTIRGNKQPITITGGITLPNGVLNHPGMTLTAKSLTHSPSSAHQNPGQEEFWKGAYRWPVHCTSLLDHPVESTNIAPRMEGGTVLTSALHGHGTLPAHLASAGITHVVTPLGSHHTGSLSGLTPLVTPVTVVSQGNQVAHILATPQQLSGKVMTTAPLLKSVGPVPIMNAQYLSTATLVKPVVVVSSPSALPPHTHS